MGPSLGKDAGYLVGGARVKAAGLGNPSAQERPCGSKTRAVSVNGKASVSCIRTRVGARSPSHVTSSTMARGALSVQAFPGAHSWLRSDPSAFLLSTQMYWPSRGEASTGPMPTPPPFLAV